MCIYIYIDIQLYARACVKNHNILTFLAKNNRENTFLDDLPTV